MLSIIDNTYFLF